MAENLLIENGTLLTLGEKPRVLRGHSLLIEGDRIGRIAPKQRFPKFRGRRIDAAGKIVMPGLINAHTHCYSTFARGFTGAKPSANFLQVLRNLWWRLDSALTEEDCYYSALVAMVESIRHGTTTVIDHHASPNAVRGSLAAIARAVRQTGLRACLCYEVSDRDGRAVAAEGLAENVEFLRQAAGSPQVAALFGLHAAFTLKAATLERAAKLGRECGAGFHIHVAEAASDQAHSRRHFGASVVERLDRCGILGQKSIAAHCVHVNQREMDLLAQSGTAVVHNPQSNLNNAVGIADIVAMTQRGILVGLGTDAMTTNMQEELRVAIWAQHFRAGKPAVGFGEAAGALLVNNGKIAERIFQRPLGVLEEGGAADVILVDYDPPTPLDSANCYGHLVFGISQSAVDTTIACGRVLMRQRRLTLDLDEARINARARELAARLWKRF